MKKGWKVLTTMTNNQKDSTYDTRDFSKNIEANAGDLKTSRHLNARNQYRKYLE